jgi:hypothetical protein
MYQNAGIGTITLGLPVSFFSYFGSLLILSIVLIYISNKFNKSKIFIILIVVFFAFFVQLMNSTFSSQANKDFNRLETIERFLTSDAMKNFEGKDIYSTDIFITKDALYIHDNYWNEYTSLRNININFINDNPQEDVIKLYYLEKYNTFEITYENNIYLFSENELNGNIELLYNDDNIELEIENNKTTIGNWNVYNIIYEKNNFNQCYDFTISNNLIEI